METPMPEVTRSIRIKAPAGTIWRWLATQEGLSRWIAANISIDLRVGGTYRFLGPDEQTWVSGTVLELKPERSPILVWSEDGVSWLNTGAGWRQLTPVTDGTEVVLIHDGFEGVG